MRETVAVAAGAATYLVGTLLSGPTLVGLASGLTVAVASIAMVDVLLAVIAGRVAAKVAHPAPLRPLRATAAVCLATLLGIAVGLAFLVEARSAAQQAALLVPMVAGILLLAPAAFVAERAARAGRGA
ncbi:MAG TPA: hypothetical protein VJ874_06300 [Candidatus Thermoplasmatota archaeon]|nr:hypothetical protein [Candidatus Thermoplasmatota archaeon]